MADETAPPSLAVLEARVAWCDDLLRDHVARYAQGLVQGSDGWIEVKSKIVGGSELATLLGLNPYANRNSLLAKKAGIEVGTPPGIACWWGTLFEPVSERVVELQCSTTIHGTSIHIREASRIVGHGNSPDGYCVLKIVEGPDGPELISDLAQAAAAGDNVYVLPVLVELKAPYQRLPNGSVPKQYGPQVLSGAAFCDDVPLGLYVEIVYRLCTLEALGASPDYCTGYHRRDAAKQKRSGPWTKALGWGCTAVYAPLPSARPAQPARPAPAADMAALLDAAMPGGSPAPGPDKLPYRVLALQNGAPVRAADFGVQVADLGLLADELPSLFDEVIGRVNRGTYRARHSDPVLVGHTDGSALQAFWAAADDAPPGMFLLGLLPWKIFEADYHLVAKEEGFFERVQPLVTSFLEDLAAIQAAGSPDAVRRAYAQFCQGHAPSAEKIQEKLGLTAADVAAAFAALQDPS